MRKSNKIMIKCALFILAVLIIGTYSFAQLTGTQIVEVTEKKIISNLYEFASGSDLFEEGSLPGTDVEEASYMEASKKGNIITVKSFDVKTQGGERITSEKQFVSKIPYRNANDEELWYVDNSRYERPTMAIRYEIETVEDVTLVRRKEILDENENVKEVYDYKYDENNEKVIELTKKAQSKFKNEMREYETVKFYYKEGEDKFLYYNVLDSKGNLQFTYSREVASNIEEKADTEEMFVQYEPNTKPSNANPIIAVDTDGNLTVNFIPEKIQYVIASKFDRTSTYIFNGDGSTRQSRIKVK